MNRILRYINTDNSSEDCPIVDIENATGLSAWKAKETDPDPALDLNKDLQDPTILFEDYLNSGIEHKFENTWVIWYHHVKNNWRIDGFNNIFTITNIKDYWDLNNHINYIGGISTYHLFMMKKNINPIWEDKNNKNGGCWSIKIPTEKSYELWIKLSMHIVGETITTELGIVTGLSICAKNPVTSVIKIWNNNNKKNSIELLPRDILNEYGFNIIYKSHIPEY